MLRCNLRLPSGVFLAVLFAAGWCCAQLSADEPYGRFQFDVADREHWAFMPVRRPEVPVAPDSAWGQNPIDAFIFARLSEAGLTPNAPADRRTLLRRVYLDLIGLSPTPAEQEAFLADTAPDAFARVVDALLARAEYGERWGRHWLDVVRYAESNGYERDGAKPSAWRYRDYVIDALNADKPYDRFLIEQLAGDELSDATAETCIATTFLRLGPWDDEPADPLVDRYDQLDDVLGTTSATFLAQTLRCARCHDHKFESFTQRDYTRMLAIFEPLKRPQDKRTDLDRHVGTAQELAEYRAASAKADEQVATLRGARDRAEWEICKRLASAGILAGAPRTVVVPTSQSEAQSWQYTFNSPGADWAAAGYAADGWLHGPGGFGTAGTAGAIVRTAWSTREIWLRRDFDLSAEAVAPAELARLQLLLHHDEDCEVYFNGVLAARFNGFKTEYQPAPISPAALTALKPGRNCLAVHCTHGGGGQFIDVGLISVVQPPPATGGDAEGGKALAAETIEALLVAPETRNAKQQEAVQKGRARLKQILHVAGGDQDKQSLAAFEQQLDAADKSRPPAPKSAYIWFEEGPQAPGSQVWKRGDPRSPLEEINAGFPAVLVDAPPQPATPTANSTGRRLQLAQWLARADHPLTARVIVNRVWQHHFGDGLVGTENDFGVMSESCTHPELLDWLASEFVAGGWRLKNLHRLILLSKTYQMSSAANATAAAQDPADDLLWRYPARRLEAEAIRDCVLQASGQLNRQMGGPSVFPAIAAEVMAGQSRPGDGWKKSEAADAARRSIYVFVKRTLLVPELEVLDFPDTNGTCEQRGISTVAPQALTWLNGSFIREQSEHFAARLAREAGDDTQARIELAYRLALARPAADAERATVSAFLEKHAQRIEADAKSTGKAVDARQQALAAFCLVLLNGNEFVYVR